MDAAAKKPRAAAAKAKEEVAALIKVSARWTENRERKRPAVEEIPSRTTADLVPQPAGTGRGKARKDATMADEIRLAPGAPALPLSFAAVAEEAAALSVSRPEDSDRAAAVRADLEAVGASRLFTPMFTMRKLREVERAFVRRPDAPAKGGAPDRIEIASRSAYMRRGGKEAAPAPVPSSRTEEEELWAEGLPDGDPGEPLLYRYLIERGAVTAAFEQRRRLQMAQARFEPESVEMPASVPIGVEHTERLSTEPYGTLLPCSWGSNCIGAQRKHPGGEHTKPGSFAFPRYMSEDQWKRWKATGQVDTEDLLPFCVHCYVFEINYLADQQALHNRDSSKIHTYFHHLKCVPGGYTEMALRETVDNYTNGITVPFRRFDASDLVPVEREVSCPVQDTSSPDGRVVWQRRIVRGYKERDELIFVSGERVESKDAAQVRPAAQAFVRFESGAPPRADEAMRVALMDRETAVKPPHQTAVRSRAAPEDPPMPSPAAIAARIAALSTRLENVERLPERDRRSMLSSLAAQTGAVRTDARILGEIVGGEAAVELQFPVRTYLRLKKPLNPPAGLVPPEVTPANRRYDVCLRDPEDAKLLLLAWVERPEYAGDWQLLARDYGLEEDQYGEDLAFRPLPPLSPDRCLLHLFHARLSLGRKILALLETGECDSRGKPISTKDVNTPQAADRRKKKQAQANRPLSRQVDYFCRMQEPVLGWYRREGDRPDSALLAPAPGRPRLTRALDDLLFPFRLEKMPVTLDDLSNVRYSIDVHLCQPPFELLRNAYSDGRRPGPYADPAERALAVRHAFDDFRATVAFLAEEAPEGFRVPTSAWLPGYSDNDLATEEADSFVAEDARRARADEQRKQLDVATSKKDASAPRRAAKMARRHEQANAEHEERARALSAAAEAFRDAARAKNEKIRALFEGLGRWKETGHAILAALTWRVNVASRYLDHELQVLRLMVRKPRSFPSSFRLAGREAARAVAPARLDPRRPSPGRAPSSRGASGGRGPRLWPAAAGAGRAEHRLPADGKGDGDAARDRRPGRPRPGPQALPVFPPASRRGRPRRRRAGRRLAAVRRALRPRPVLPLLRGLLCRRGRDAAHLQKDHDGRPHLGLGRHARALHAR